MSLFLFLDLCSQCCTEADFYYCEPKLKSENAIILQSQAVSLSLWLRETEKCGRPARQKADTGLKASNNVTMHAFSSCIKEFLVKKLLMYSERL